MATRVAASPESHNPFLRLRTGLGGEMLAEFFGTFVLIALGDGSVAASVAGLPGSGCVSRCAPALPGAR
jgi:glycerol uptake facilitator protein